MKNLYKHKRQEGFTIIEVMIVLAIAAVILLIVLLAVPALQRNSRNTQRNNDAAQLAAAINTCLANHNGDVSATSPCRATGNNGVDVDFSKLGQLTAATYAVGQGSTTSANWAFGQDCNGGATMTGSASAKAVAVAFVAEASGGGTTNRCISG